MPLPPAAATLGFEFVEADPEQGTIEVAFTPAEAFTTPRDDVLEGFLAAMGDLAFLESVLTDVNGRLLASGSATARVIAFSG
jgi:acyl-coenzyme A thioesterase PaaI-like protein